MKILGFCVLIKKQIAIVLADVTIVMGATISENDQISFELCSFCFCFFPDGNLYQCCRRHEQILLAQL